MKGVETSPWTSREDSPQSPCGREPAGWMCSVFETFPLQIGSGFSERPCWPGHSRSTDFLERQYLQGCCDWRVLSVQSGRHGLVPEPARQDAPWRAANLPTSSDLERANLRAYP